MSNQNIKITNKRLYKTKSNNLLITPLFSNQTTANTTNKNTIVINSLKENKRIIDFSEKENISPNVKNENKIQNFIVKKQLNPNCQRNRNSPLRNMFIKNLDNSINENPDSNKKSIINISKSINLNSYRPYFNSNNINHKKMIKNRSKNKNIYFIDKILNNKYNRSSKNIIKIQNNLINMSQERKKSLSKEKKKNIIKINHHISNPDMKGDIDKLSYDNQKNNYNKKTISRNYILKESSSVKTNYTNINNNSKSITNSISNTKGDKNKYFKKKVDDSFKYINIKKIVNKNYNKQNIYNNLNNHNYLINLFLGENKVIKNNNLNLYNNKNNNKIKSFEINNKSNFYSKSIDIIKFNNSGDLNNNISNKKSIPKPLISRNKIKVNLINESPMKGLSSNLYTNYKSINFPKSNKVNFLKKNNKNLHKFQSYENKIKQKNINKIWNRSSDKINKNDNNNQKLNINKKYEEKIHKNIKTSESSIIIGKDSFLDYLIDTISKSKNKKENLDNLINQIKINNYSIKKPKEENMKFTLLKNKIEESTSEINKSKVIIGEIEGYKDIIESDKINNYFKSQKENSIKLFGYNTIDKNINEKSQKGKKFLLNLNNNDDLEINNTTNVNNANYNCFVNDTEVKKFLNYIEEVNEFEDLSTKALKKSQNNEKKLMPYHVNKISFVKIYDEKKNNYIIKENIDKNVLLINDKNNNNNKNNDYNYKEKININEEFFHQKDLLLTDKNFSNNNNKLNRKALKIFLNKGNKKSLNNNNIIQNSCNFSIEVNHKKCAIF